MITVPYLVICNLTGLNNSLCRLLEIEYKERSQKLACSAKTSLIPQSDRHRQGKGTDYSSSSRHPPNLNSLPTTRDGFTASGIINYYLERSHWSQSTGEVRRKDYLRNRASSLYWLITLYAARDVRILLHVVSLCGTETNSHEASLES